MDKRLKRILKEAKRRQKRMFDVVFVIVGKTRMGKSTLCLHCLDYLGVKKLRKHMALEGDEFMDLVINAKDQDVVAADEAVDILFSRESMTKRTRKMVKLFNIIGYKRLITFLLIPNIMQLDKYFRHDRVSGLFYVYKRKYFNFWDDRSYERYIKPRLLRYHHIPVNPHDGIYFGKYKGKLKDEYEILKQAYVYGAK